jgi:protein-tyrosine phosphatase
MTTGVLFVCTGNICRSPAAELLLSSRLADQDVAVSSAGTRARVGEPVHPPMAELLRAAGVSPEPFAARLLSREQLAGADLVLVMTREHRTAAVALAPAAVRRSFLLLEAVAMASSISASGWPAEAGVSPAERLAALPGLAGRHRTARGQQDREVPDPYQRPIEDYRESFDTVAAAVDRLVEVLA